MLKTKLLLIITIVALVVELASPSITLLRFLQNHTRIVITGFMFATAWLTALICVPIAMFCHNKYHDRQSLWAMWLSVAVIVMPVIAVFAVLFGMGVGMNF